MEFDFVGMDHVLPVGERESLIHGSVRYPLSRPDYGVTGTDKKAAHKKKDKWNSRQYRQRMSCYTSVWRSEQHISSGFFSQKSRSEERKPST